MAVNESGNLLTRRDYESRPGAGSAGRVLVVDDEDGNRIPMSLLLKRAGYQVSVAGSGLEALEVVARDHPDVILLDVMMPDLDGFEVCRRLKAAPATRLLPVVLVTGMVESDARIRGIDAGADDFLTKPFNAHELRARVRSLIRIKHYTDDLDASESVIVSLALIIEARDPSTEGHCQRLAAYASALGARLGLPDKDLETLRRGGFLHDIGKVGIPDSVLLKPGPLTRDEFELMKTHTVIGERLCVGLRSLARVCPIVRGHHERLDGSGYPDQLIGQAIPLLAQVMGIVDVFDALTTARPYKAALPTNVAVDMLRREVELGWRGADLVEAFIELTTEGGPLFALCGGTASSRSHSL